VPGLTNEHKKPSAAGLILVSALPASALARGRAGGARSLIFGRIFSSSARASTNMTSKAARFSTPIDSSHLPLGFKVAATYAGIKAAISPVATPPPSSSSKSSPKPDLALITTDEPVAAAGTFTRNVFKAAPVVLSSDLLLQGSKTSRGSRAKSVLVNSGCANAVTGKGGYRDAQQCAEWISKMLPSKNEQDNKTLLLSTGVIGVPLPMSAIEKALPEVTRDEVLGNQEEKWWQVARAFMTTDTFPKLKAKTFTVGGRKCGIVGIDKGAGMIHPSMTGPSSTSGVGGQLHATLLGLICTDAPVEPSSLQEALEVAMSRSFNCISVDGDMSTNDTIIALASGLAPEIEAGKSTIKPNTEISKTKHPQEYSIFVKELTDFCTEMAHLIVRDGEGAEKFVEVQVKGAPSYPDAHAIASSISTSALVKCALHGSDANWGRILCAAGYTNLRSSSNEFQSTQWAIDPSTISVRFIKPSTCSSESDIVSELVVLQDGTPVKVDEAKAKSLLDLEDIIIEIDLKGGTWGEKGNKETCKYWTCDFSKEYISVRLNIDEEGIFAHSFFSPCHRSTAITDHSTIIK
jgi:glutamate N-acetyltransferase/amino-acid N-acetyltransferase